MGFLSKLMGRPETAVPEMESTPASCPHLVLVPRWDSVADIGHTDRATSFRCEVCGRDFSPAEARMLRSSEGDRVRETVPPEARN